MNTTLADKVAAKHKSDRDMAWHKYKEIIWRSETPQEGDVEQALELVTFLKKDPKNPEWKASEVVQYDVSKVGWLKGILRLQSKEKYLRDKKQTLSRAIEKIQDDYANKLQKAQDALSTFMAKEYLDLDYVTTEAWKAQAFGQGWGQFQDVQTLEDFETFLAEGRKQMMDETSPIVP